MAVYLSFGLKTNKCFIKSSAYSEPFGNIAANDFFLATLVPAIMLAANGDSMASMSYIIK